MFSVSDILKVLDQIPIWKTLSALPKRVAELEARVKVLEGNAGARRGPQANECPTCGATLTFATERDHPTFGPVGIKEHTLRCDACGFQTKRQYQPGQGYL